MGHNSDINTDDIYWTGIFVGLDKDVESSIIFWRFILQLFSVCAWNNNHSSMSSDFRALKAASLSYINNVWTASKSTLLPAINFTSWVWSIQSLYIKIQQICTSFHNLPKARLRTYYSTTPAMYEIGVVWTLPVNQGCTHDRAPPSSPNIWGSLWYCQLCLRGYRAHVRNLMFFGNRAPTRFVRNALICLSQSHPLVSFLPLLEKKLSQKWHITYNL